MLITHNHTLPIKADRSRDISFRTLEDKWNNRWLMGGARRVGRGIINSLRVHNYVITELVRTEYD